MAIICTKTWSTRDFNYTAKDRTLSIEASTLRAGFPGRRTFGPVYDDACDMGFVLESHKTGRKMTFVINKVDKDRDGDIAGWWLTAAAVKDRALGIKVLVIND
jgi:hypothetical protein